MPVTETHAKYIGGLEYEDEVEVTCKLTELSIARCKFEYEVYRRSDNKLMNVGYTKHGFVDETFSPVNLKKKNEELWQLLESAVLK